MKKNIIICTYGTGIGGMEVLFANYAKFLLSRNYRVFFLTRDTDNNIYNKLLSNEGSDLRFVKYKPCDILYSLSEERKEIKSSVLKQMKDVDWSRTYSVCGYFVDVLLLMNIFGDKKIPITLIWPHPLNWINCLYFDNKRYHFKKKRHSSLYKYQKKLIEDMDSKYASFYTSYAIFHFNKWYYEANLIDRVIEGLPIQINSGTKFEYNAKDKIDVLRVLWVGRFDFFKNDAIIYIFNSLVYLSEKYKIKIVFNIAGHGGKRFEDELRNIVKPGKIDVNYLGVIPPEQLNSVFSQNDVGIAMGVTVKQMGYAGLPAILIDSITKSYNEEKICNWVFDIETGDDGDGMYYKTMNKPLTYRKTLNELLVEILQNPELLKLYSERCSKYVLDNYSYERQYEVMTKRVENSKFDGSSYQVYRYKGLGLLLRRAAFGHHGVLSRKIIKIFRKCF